MTLAGHLTSLFLGFSICKIEIMIVATSNGPCEDLDELTHMESVAARTCHVESAEYLLFIIRSQTPGIKLTS